MKFRKCWRKSNKEECQYFDLSAVGEYYTTKNPNLIEELKELSVSIVSMCDRVDEINEELKQ